MAKISKEEILKSVEEMTVLELADLVRAIEEKFGVSAAPVAVAQAQTGSTADSGEPKEEQTVFNVVLTSCGDNKIGVIKAVRELVPTLGLQEAKTLVESAPKDVLTSVNKVTAEEAKKKLETAGAKVELK
ncbi:MAG: 50S ribosomal protein L7/L12 [bacterium]|nr:50S ribosomal protein L7/L12 [bacterium]